MPAMTVPRTVRLQAEHRLALYRRAVQHPLAEVAFFERAWRRAQRSPGKLRREVRQPLLLREDFAGTAAVAAAWVASHPQRQAMAVDRHAPTLRWAWRQAQRELGPRADDLHLVCGDALAVRGPRVDVIAALNFSSFIFHDRSSLRSYFRAARQALRPGGVLVIDAFGGPGAQRLGIQRRAVPAEEHGPRFTYLWEQRRFDPVTSRIDCRMHFELGRGSARRRIDNAFRYDWRLWTLPELVEVMTEAGLAGATVWCDRFDARISRSDGRYRPTRHMPAREDFVACVTGNRSG